MRFLIILGLVALLAISLASAWPADQSGSDSSTESGNDQAASGEEQSISPKPRWPRWGGIGPVIVNPRPTKLGTL